LSGYNDPSKSKTWKVLEPVWSHLNCVVGMKLLLSKRHVFHLAELGRVNRGSHRSRKTQGKTIVSGYLTLCLYDDLFKGRGFYFKDAARFGYIDECLDGQCRLFSTKEILKARRLGCFNNQSSHGLVVTP